MSGGHPFWCTGGEAPGDDHRSATLRPALPADLIGIEVTLCQPGEDIGLALVEVVFADEGEITTHLLPVRQAQEFAEALARVAV